MIQTLTDRVEVVVECMRQQRMLRFEYHDREGRVTYRLVEPEIIRGVDLLAWCLHREERRRFALMRMRGVRIGPHESEVLLPLASPDVKPADW